MERQGRRNHRGRDRRSRQYNAQQHFNTPNSPTSWSFMDGFSSLFIMTSLIAIVYLMLDYHCTVCNTANKGDLTNITKNIDDIAVNMSQLKDSYYDLEAKVIKFSYELPKIGGQIELLESLANTLGSGDFRTTEYETESKVDYALPKRVFETSLRNVSRKNQKLLKLGED